MLAGLKPKKLCLEEFRQRLICCKFAVSQGVIRRRIKSEKIWSQLYPPGLKCHPLNRQR